jgi:cytochrome P450
MTGCPYEADGFAGFDHHSDHHRDGAETLWTQMRETPGLPYSELYGGFYVVTRHADLRKIAAQHQIFSSAQGVALPSEHRTRHIPEEVDPPLQREYRRLLDPFLTPEAAAKHEPIARAIAIELLDSLQDTPRLDVVARFTETFPVYFSLAAFGFPRADADKLVSLVNRLIHGRESENGRQAGIALTDYLVAFLASREATALSPADDIVAAIALGTVSGRRLELQEKVSMTRLLLFGGFTTVNLALSYSMYLFAKRPELVERLRGQLDGISTAIEEIIRLSSPGTYLRRTLTQDAEVGGTALKAGDQVLLCFGAANRDPAIFELPDEVVFERNPNPHLGFGFGTHRCMGSMLAKLEMRVAITELLERYERFELDPDHPPVWGGGETQGLASLPMILHARSTERRRE